MKLDIAAIIVACVAAATSLVALFVSPRLSERNERRKAIWERELARFIELEEVAGQLIDDVFAYRMRDETTRNEVYDKLRFIKLASGRFLRYQRVSTALHKLVNSAGWSISQDMKHESTEEFQKTRAELDADFRELLAACDQALQHVHKRL